MTFKESPKYRTIAYRLCDEAGCDKIGTNYKTANRPLCDKHQKEYDECSKRLCSK